MLGSIALIFITGLLMGSLFKKIKLPPLIGMLIAGIIIGPFVLNLLSDDLLSISGTLRQIALIIILTRAGLSLNLKDLKEIGRPGFLLSFLPAIFEITATIIFAPIILNISYLDAALLGTVIASASPAVIVPRMLKLMEEKRGTNKKIPQMILAGDSIDDIFNIVLFTMLLTYQTGDNSSLVLQILQIPSSIILGALLGIITGLLLTYLFKKFKMNLTTKVVILLSIGFLLVTLESRLENIVAVSGLLAIMVSGIVLLKKLPNEAYQLEQSFKKLWIPAEVLLFVLIGASVNINYATDLLWQTILLLVIILIFRALGTFICLIGTNLNFKEKAFTMITCIPKATVQAAIGGIPFMYGLPSGAMILSVAVITILFTAPIGAFLIDISYMKLLTLDSISMNEDLR